jgi:hypothetical protein
MVNTVLSWAVRNYSADQHISCYYGTRRLTIKGHRSALSWTISIQFSLSKHLYLRPILIMSSHLFIYIPSYPSAQDFSSKLFVCLSLIPIISPQFSHVTVPLNTKEGKIRKLKIYMASFCNCVFRSTEIKMAGWRWRWYKSPWYKTMENKSIR